MKKQPIPQSVLIKLYVKEQKTIKVIAKLLGRGEATVLGYLREYDIPTRPRNQWLGRKHRPESIELLRKKQLGKKLSEKTKKKLSIALKGRKHDWCSKRIFKEGYVMLFQPENPMSNSGGYVYEHRIVMAEKVGRNLQREEIVHHIDGVRDDNRPENLVILTRSVHVSSHERQEEKREWRSKMMSEKRKNKFWSTKKRVLKKVLTQP